MCESACISTVQSLSRMYSLSHIFIYIEIYIARVVERYSHPSTYSPKTYGSSLIYFLYVTLSFNVYIFLLNFHFFKYTNIYIFLSLFNAKKKVCFVFRSYANLMHNIELYFVSQKLIIFCEVFVSLQAVWMNCLENVFPSYFKRGNYANVLKSELNFVLSICFVLQNLLS